MKQTNNTGKGKPQKDVKVSLRGRTFIGVVVSSKSQKTATVEWVRKQYVPKYERYEKKRTKIQVHNPESIDAKEGDKVKIMECRPISKTKHFVIIEKMGKEELYLDKKSTEEEERGKISHKKKKEENKDETNQSQDS